MAERPIVTVDLFCGAGGLSEGFRLAGARTIVASDFDDWAGATYAENHEPRGTRFILGDITKEKVRRDITEGRAGIPLSLRTTVVNASTCKPPISTASVLTGRPSSPSCSTWSACEWVRSTACGSTSHFAAAACSGSSGAPEST